MRKKLFALMYVLVFGLPVCAVYADYQVTQGSGTTFFDFICFTSKHCPAHVNINSAGTEVGTSGAPLRVDPTGTTTQPVSSTTLMLDATGQSILSGVQSAVPGGTNDIGIVHVVQGVSALTVQIGNTPNTTPILATVTPSVGGGWTTSLKNGLTNTASAIKAGAGTFGAYYCNNPNATVACVQVYNIASGSVTVGTSTPSWSICLPASGAANLEFTNGLKFATAISVAATTTATGGSAPGTALDCNFGFN